jgi:hypothetical protein
MSRIDVSRSRSMFATLLLAQHEVPYHKPPAFCQIRKVKTEYCWGWPEVSAYKPATQVFPEQNKKVTWWWIQYSRTTYDVICCGVKLHRFTWTSRTGKTRSREGVCPYDATYPDNHNRLEFCRLAKQKDPNSGKTIEELLGSKFDEEDTYAEMIEKLGSPWDSVCK